MGYFYAERLIEYAIRVGTDDLQTNQKLVNLMFPVDKKTGAGTDMTPPGATEKVVEQLPMDYFQKRLREIPKLKAETGQQEIFKNSLPEIGDIYEYLNKNDLNFRITHGFPREAQDLPCISITLGNEEESQYLGGQKGAVDGKGTRYVLVGSDWSSQYNINILSPNYDETILWYHILKYCFTVYRPVLEAYGMRQINCTWTDPEPAAEYLQSGLFVYQRTCILSCVKDEDVPIEQKAYNELAFQLANIQEQSNGEIVPDLTPDPENPGGQP